MSKVIVRNSVRDEEEWGEGQWWVDQIGLVLTKTPARCYVCDRAWRDRSRAFLQFCVYLQLHYTCSHPTSALYPAFHTLQPHFFGTCPLLVQYYSLVKGSSLDLSVSMEYLDPDIGVVIV